METMLFKSPMSPRGMKKIQNTIMGPTNAMIKEFMA